MDLLVMTLDKFNYMYIAIYTCTYYMATGIVDVHTLRICNIAV